MRGLRETLARRNRRGGNIHRLWDRADDYLMAMRNALLGRPDRSRDLLHNCLGVAGILVRSFVCFYLAGL